MSPIITATPSAGGYVVAPALTARALIAETGDPLYPASAGSTPLIDQRLQLGVVAIPVGTVISKVGFICTAVGAVGTLFKMGLFKTDGTFLRATADVKASLVANTIQVFSLTASYTADVGAFYLAMLSVGGTPPSGAAGAPGGSAYLGGVNGGVRHSAQVAAQADISGNVTPAGTITPFYMVAA